MKIIELLIDKLEDLNGFDAVALVEEPAIEADFFAFNNKKLLDTIQLQVLKLAIKEQFVERLPGESKDSYIARCIPVLKSEGYGDDQAAAICYDALKLNLDKIIQDGKPLYDTKEEAERVALEIGCEGSHEHEIDGKIWYMPCATHTETNDRLLELDIDVSSLPNYVNPVKEEEYEFESYTDYPQSATNAAKRALEYRDAHPDNDCGTRTGWARANQLANRRPISEDTIARMASFKRHQQHKDVPYSEGCGGLMWDCWGGTAGIEWASNKLEKIRASAVSLSSEDIIESLPIKEQERILETLSLRGINEAKLSKEGYERVDAEEFFKHVFTSAKTGLPIKGDAQQADALTTKGAKVLYEYVGPLDQKTRKFCRRMLQLSKRGTLWSKSDLQNIQGSNPEFPAYYNIYLYKGSYGCRHSWKTVYLYQKKPKKQKVTVSFLNKAKTASKEYKFGIDRDKKRLVGPMLIPNKLILRVDEEGKPFYVYFSEDTVRQIAEKAIKDKLIDSVNLEHNPDVPVDAHMTSSWIVEDPNNDKSNMYDMKVPKGTWMAEYKVEDDRVWDMVKDGVVNGFSIEGIFQNKRIQ
jgi:hypothetical protein